MFRLPKRPVDRTSSCFKAVFRLERPWNEQIEWFVQACAAENLPVQRGYPALHTIPWVREQQARDLVACVGEYPISADLSDRTFNIATGPGISLELADQIAAGVMKVEASLAEMV